MSDKAYFDRRALLADSFLHTLATEHGLEVERLRMLFRATVRIYCEAAKQEMPAWAAPGPEMTDIEAIGGILDVMTKDAIRFDWLEAAGNGVGLVHDDNKHWAVCFAGTQPVPGDAPQNMATTHFVKAEEWQPSVREAIDYAIRKEREEEAEDAST